jgi:hypothetical protein
LNRKCDILVSNFAFTFNLYRYSTERDRLQLAESKMAAMQQAAEDEAMPNGPGARTTAEPRPNAYVPQDSRSMGVPKPYGRYAPFKPTELGSNMRHIRKPEPREIVI